MAPDSPESPSKKRKHRNHSRRDQPLFASRRSHPTLQQPPDFLTESINTSRNTSCIPTPSPEKSPTRESLRAKPRQAIDRKSLATAFTNTPPRLLDNENHPPSSKSIPRLSRPESARKPSPTTQASSRKPSKSPANPGKSPSRARTPTPPRGRQYPVESPANSESSPGRGYAEAYQRIVEEENLAQEDSIEDMDLEDFEYSQEDVSQELDRLRSQERQTSESPISLRTLRKASPRFVSSGMPTEEEMDKENRGGEIDDASVGSHLQDATETSIGSGSSQYARDRQRLNNALKGSGQAFSKAKVGERAGLNVQNLRRSNGSNESLGSALSSGSLSHKGSDPSVNVPKAWGRKAKPGKDWLNRINSRSGRFTGDPPKRVSSGDTIIAENEKRRSQGAVDQWMAAAQVPLPESSPLVNGSSQGSTPKATLQRNTPLGTTPLDRRREWDLEQDDFTGRSLQVSESPPIRIRNATLDHMRDREIETLEKRAVTTNRLGELRERASQSSLEKQPSTASSLDQTEDVDEEDVGRLRRKTSTSFGHQTMPQDTKTATPEDTLEDLGEPIPGTPVVIYKTSSISSTRKYDDDAHIRSTDRPSHQRGESHDLLKRLARVSSQSPSPTKEQERMYEPTQKTEVKEAVEQTPQVLKPRIYQKTPVITGAWIDQTQKVDQTPQTSTSNAVLKTPFVTGGWVETPLPTGGRGLQLPTPSDVEQARELSTSKLGADDIINKLSSESLRPKLRSQEPLKYTGPPLPKSALEEIINEARSGKPKSSSQTPDSGEEEDPTLHLGESTIQSLQDLVTSDTDVSTLLAPPSPCQEPSPTTSFPTDLTNVTTQNPPPQLDSYRSLLTRLTALAPSLRASKRQLAALEQTVSTTTSLQPRPNQECNEAGPLHDFLYPCPTCSCPGRISPPPSLLTIFPSSIPTTTTLIVSIPFPLLWTWPTHPRSWRPRLTWLGLAVLLTYTYLFAENWAQITFCHPLHATSMRGYGVDITAPEPPFVLFQVLYRNLALASLLHPVYVALRTLCRLAAKVGGYVVGVVGGGVVGGVREVVAWFGELAGGGGWGEVVAWVVGVVREAAGGGDGDGGEGVRQPVSRDGRIPRPSWGPDLSLLDDEYL